MKTPELVVTSKPDDDFLTGECSACPHVHFTLPSNTLTQKMILRAMFDQHAKRVHGWKDNQESQDIPPA